MREVGWDWVPPNASEAAKKEWQKNWLTRAREVLRPSEATFRNYMLALIESFSLPELHDAVARRTDIVDVFVTIGKLRHALVRPWARLALQQNQRMAYHWLVGWRGYEATTGPGALLLELAARDPDKGALLRSPDGWAWFQGECYELARFFRDFARLHKRPYNWPELLPPPGHTPRPPPDLTAPHA